MGSCNCATKIPNDYGQSVVTENLMPCSNSNDELKAIDSKLETKHISNPYVIIIGIEKYETQSEALYAVPTDIIKMKTLWEDTYKYEHVSCITDDLPSSTIITKHLFSKYITKQWVKIVNLEHIDGLIFVYSGHGTENKNKDELICGDLGTVPFQTIMQKFANSPHGIDGCEPLNGKPKLFYLDCCRGSASMANDIKIIRNQQAKGLQFRYINKMTDLFIHHSTCPTYQSWTSENKQEGSYLIDALFELFTENQKNNKFVQLSQVSPQINQRVEIKSKGIQTPQVKSTLSYDVYITPHQQELPMSLTQQPDTAKMEKQINALRQQLNETVSSLNKQMQQTSQLNQLLEDAKVSMKSVIIELGDEYIQEWKDQQATRKNFKSLMELHDRFLKILKEKKTLRAEEKEKSRGEVIFEMAIKEAFEALMNKTCYIAAALAGFANDVLKKPENNIVIDDLEHTMDNIVLLYGYIRDRDIFESDYQMYFASRLLQNLSNEQTEREMIGKLKNVSGYHWTSKLEDMFKDIQRSKVLMQAFYDTYNDIEFQLTVSVCTSGAWPGSFTGSWKKPTIIEKATDMFEQFYLSRFSGRKLRFQMGEGRAELEIQFNAKCAKILDVSTYQMMILLLFNDGETLTFKEIMSATGIEREELIDELLSMAHPKIRIMRKAPNTKHVEDSDKFQINLKYANARSKIRIPTLRFRKPKSNNQIDDAIVRLRRHQMDAAIIRVMKAKKTLNCEDLIAEVIKQLIARFKAKKADIKKEISMLIDMEYLEKDEEDKQLLHYKY